MYDFLKKKISLLLYDVSFCNSMIIIKTEEYFFSNRAESLSRERYIEKKSQWRRLNKQSCHLLDVHYWNLHALLNFLVLIDTEHAAIEWAFRRTSCTFLVTHIFRSFIQQRQTLEISPLFLQKFIQRKIAR